MINWKLRIKNKTTLVAIITLGISIVYQVLHICGIVPVVEQQAIVDVCCAVIDLLALLGIVVDPTTEGIADSSRALSYEEPASERNFTRHDDNRKGR